MRDLHELEGNEKNSLSKNTCMHAECETINRNLNGHNFTVNGISLFSPRETGGQFEHLFIIFNWGEQSEFLPISFSAEGSE